MLIDVEGWNDHLVPIDQTDIEFKQVKKIPVKHITAANPEEIPIEKLWYLFGPPSEWEIYVEGYTLEGVEANRRKVFLFDLKNGLGLDSSQKFKTAAREILKYYHLIMI
jgi:hypothetical protein